MTLDQMLRMENPDGTPALIADPLRDRYGLSQALEVQAANNQFTHNMHVVADYGTVETRRINEGAKIVNPQTREMTTRIIYLEARLQIDELLLMGKDNPKFYMNQRWMMAVKGMGAGIAKRLQYDNATEADPEGMQGLTARFNAISMANVFDAGGTASGALTSIYVMETTPLEFYGLYLKGVGNGKGFSSQHKGIQTIWKNGRQFDAEVTKIAGSSGLGIEDDRCVQRICNIDTALTGAAQLNKSEDALDAIIRAKNKLPDKGMGSGSSRAFLLVNSTTHSQLEIARKNANNVDFMPVDWLGGRHALVVAGLPVIYDAGILDTESRVV